MTELTKTELRSKINNLLPSNNPNAVSAANFRELLTDLVDSLLGSKGDTSSVFTEIGSGNFINADSTPTFTTQINSPIINIPEDVEWFGIILQSTVDNTTFTGYLPLVIFRGDILRHSDNQVNYGQTRKSSSTYTNNDIIIEYKYSQAGDSTVQLGWVQAGSNKRLIIGFTPGDTLTATLYRVS